MSSKVRTHSTDIVSSKRRSPKPAPESLNRQAPQQTHPATLIRRAGLDPGSLTPHDVLQLQRTFGNRAVGRLLAQTSRRQPTHKEGNATGLPRRLKDSVESLSGLSLDDVKVHYNSSRPAALHASAYTQGADIHVGPGQERHLPHEVWHVVQQKQGRVTPTLQANGVAINDDDTLEREADVMGAKRHQPGDVVSPATPGATRLENVRPTPCQRVLQMITIATPWGQFKDLRYDVVEEEQKQGVDILLEFQPGESVNAEKIGMTQAIRSIKEGEPYQFGEKQDVARMKHRQIQANDNPALKGWLIDRASDNPNPIYGSDNPDPSGLSFGGYNPAQNPQRNLQGTSFENQEPGFSKLGKRIPDGETESAMLADTPTRAKPLNPNSSQQFETTALAISGTQSGKYYGSVRWGWRTDGNGTFEKLELTKVSDNNPSQAFTESAKKWNESYSKFTASPLAFIPSVPLEAFKNIKLPLPD